MPSLSTRFLSISIPFASYTPAGSYVLALMLGLSLLLAFPTHAQERPYKLKEAPGSSSRTFVGSKAESTVDDDFTLTNSAGDSLFTVIGQGSVFVGAPGPAINSGNGFESNMNRSEGSAGIFRVRSLENPHISLYGRHDGPGIAGYFLQYNDTTHSAAVLAQTVSMGAAGGFEIYNDQNEYSSVFGYTEGLGPSGNFNIDNEANPMPAVWGKTNGSGHAGNFEIQNSSSGGSAVRAWTEGTGPAGDFGVNNPSSGAPAVRASTNGTGQAAHFNITNVDNDETALSANTDGTGLAAFFSRTGSGTDYGPAVVIRQAGTSSNGQGATGLEIEHFNENNSSPALTLTSDGTGRAVDFTVQNTSNDESVLNVGTEGTGDLANFSASGDTRFRVTNSGDVFADGTFNGGGADVAEAFDVEEDVSAYEPGDVLVVSTERDRTVGRSGEAYSPRVVGVYATKPGVLLSEKGSATNWEERVPMGVVGVLPTKVTLEGGAIERGDLLVTSPTPGHAMKGDSDEIGVGQVIGKALQPYDGTGPALIEVMVNVK